MFIVLFSINLLSIGDDNVVGNGVDNNEDEFIDEDTGDVDFTVLLLFVVETFDADSLSLWVSGWLFSVLSISLVDNDGSFVWIVFTIFSLSSRLISISCHYHGDVIHAGNMSSSGLSFITLLTSLLVNDFNCW